MENPTKIDDLGGTTIFGNIHINVVLSVYQFLCNGLPCKIVTPSFADFEFLGGSPVAGLLKTRGDLVTPSRTTLVESYWEFLKYFHSSSFIASQAQVVIQLCTLCISWLRVFSKRVCFFPNRTKMARRGRTSMLSVCLGAAALLLCWQMVSPAFIQPKQNRGLEAAAPAALGALASMAGTMPAEALKGPLAGTDLCTKPLIYLIYPLCDPLFLVCPLYNFPLVLGFFAALVTVINLILPETQPDEDLRVG